MKDATLDAVGMVCPAPLIAAELELRKLKSGQVLEVVADDPGVVRDFPVWCKNTGHRFIRLERANAYYHIFISKA